MKEEDDKRGAAVKFPPPLIFLGFILCACLIHLYWPVSFPSSTILKFIGVVVIILGLAVVIAASRIFKKVDTNIEPWKPTSKIVSNGVFAYSRNPIYMAFCLVPIGVGFIVGSYWILMSFFPAAITVYFVAIKKEEIYLEQKFGDEYLTYKSNVRRWV
jgi:protein-S-isoprenylcysteine O-methyltransferase Ste14